MKKFLCFVLLLLTAHHLLHAQIKFNAPATYATGNGPSHVAVADMNGDGKPDMVVANYGYTVADNTVSVLLADGNGGYLPQAKYPTDVNPTDVAVADLNGDGKPDIVTANSVGNDVSVLLADGNGSYLPQVTYAIGKTPTAVSIADMNGDNKPDIVVADEEGGNNVAVLLNNGGGHYGLEGTYTVGAVSSNSLAVADVNGDNKPDIITGNADNNGISVLLANNGGGYHLQATYNTDEAPYVAAVADMNGDGKPDIVAANYGNNNTVSVLAGDGSGDFGLQATYNAGDNLNAVTVADMNGDKLPDIVTGNDGSNTISILLADGNGGFKPQESLNTNAPYDLTVADMNGDGLPDIVTANFYNATVSVFTQYSPKKYVKPGASGGGTSWSDAGDLQTVINNASAGDSVFVAAGTYTAPLNGSFSMKEGVKIYGGFTGTETSLAERNLVANRAAGDSSVLKGNGSSVISNSNIDTASVLDGFTITGGQGSFNVTGVPNYNLYYGGGMYNDAASPVITNVNFVNNSASIGGGICNMYGSFPMITHVNLINNTAEDEGGGIFNSTSSPVITNVNFINNTAEEGGAMNNNYASPVITDANLVNNSAVAGGGMYNDNSSPVIANVNFIHNSASGDGGGMYNGHGSPVITNVDFVNNSSSIGGGILGAGASLTMTNTVFYNNTAGTDAPDFAEQGGGTLTVNYSYTQTDYSTIGTGNITSTADPFINSADPAGADGIYGTKDDGLQLATGSLAIDAGTPDTAGLHLPAFDITGADRIQNGRIDMGAYESNYAPVILPVVLKSFTGLLQNGIANLQWTSGVEDNLNRFNLQKSTDGVSFLPQAEIPAKGSNSSYAYSVPQAEAIAYYRLAMVSNTGSTAYSSAVRLEGAVPGTGVTVYPNPAHDHINIRVAVAGSINIYDASGKLVKVQVLRQGVNEVDIHTFSTGVYYGVIGSSYKVKFIKQ